MVPISLPNEPIRLKHVTILGSESETCVGSRVRLVGASISFEKNFIGSHSLPPLWFAVSVLQVVLEQVTGLD
jgi:hypothetical protein